MMILKPLSSQRDLILSALLFQGSTLFAFRHKNEDQTAAEAYQCLCNAFCAALGSNASFVFATPNDAWPYRTDWMSNETGSRIHGMA